jgi:prepilin-type N-terminal cleavage/methylation domain-containing protein
MSERSERGFTLVEVLLAVVLLSVGILALVGSSTMVTRMIGWGRESTLVGQRSVSRFDRLRQAAYGTNPPCTSASFASGSQSAYQGVSETWTVPTTGNSRLVTLILSYRTPGRAKADTVKTYFLCK